MRTKLSLTALLLVFASCANIVKVTTLDSLEPLRTQFNADAGKPRLVALPSPT